MASRAILMTTMAAMLDRKSTRLNSSHRTISYAVFCLKKKTRFILLLVRLDLPDHFAVEVKVRHLHATDVLHLSDPHRASHLARPRTSTGRRFRHGHAE